MPKNTPPAAILVADDEASYREMLSAMLTPAGYRVETARDGVEAINTLQSKAFDLVLLDVRMPRVDGIEVLKRIKVQWPDIEVIMITGYHAITSSITSVAEAIKTLGAFDYIEKPFTPDAIIEVIDKAMKQKKEKK